MATRPPEHVRHRPPGATLSCNRGSSHEPVAQHADTLDLELDHIPVGKEAPLFKTTTSSDRPGTEDLARISVSERDTNAIVRRRIRGGTDRALAKPTRSAGSTTTPRTSGSSIRYPIGAHPPTATHAPSTLRSRRAHEHWQPGRSAPSHASQDERRVLFATWFRSPAQVRPSLPGEVPPRGGPTRPPRPEGAAQLRIRRARKLRMRQTRKYR